MRSHFLRASSGGTISPIEIVGIAFANGNANGSNLDCSLTGIGMAENDLLVVAFIGHDLLGSPPTIGTTPNVTAVETVTVDDISTRLVYEVQGSSPRTLARISSSDYGRAAILAIAFRGVDTSTPMDVTPPSATSAISDIASPPAITPASDGVMVVSFMSGSAFTSATSSPNRYPGASYSTSVGVEDNDNILSDIAIGCYSQWKGDQFTVPDLTGASPSNASVCWTIALRPA
jgi:hypothetical protein